MPNFKRQGPLWVPEHEGIRRYRPEDLSRYKRYLEKQRARLAVSPFGTPTGTATFSGSSISWSHTVGSGQSNTVLRVGCRTKVSGTSVAISDVTYNGTSLGAARISKSFAGSSYGLRSYIFAIVAPSETTANVVVTAASACELSGCASNFAGVDQTTPIANTGSNSGTSSTATCNVTSGSDEYAVDYLTSGDNLSAPTKTQEFIDAFVRGGGSRAAGAGGTLTFQWTIANDDWCICAVSFKAAGAGGASVFRRTLGQRVGSRSG